MNPNIKVILLITICVYLLASCEKEKTEPIIDDSILVEDTLEPINTRDFLFNIPIVEDTVFMDSKDRIDFRISIEGYEIIQTEVYLNNEIYKTFDTTIINSSRMLRSLGVYSISFLIEAFNNSSLDTVHFVSDTLIYKVINNLSERFIQVYREDGRLLITWPQFDKKYTDHYLIERVIPDQTNSSRFYTHEIVNSDSILIDNYYVGEDLAYRISVINIDGGKQQTWYYEKQEEKPQVFIDFDTEMGYILKFNKCQYYNNFGHYDLYDAMDPVGIFIHSTSDINDTTYLLPEVGFGDIGRFYLEFIPKEFPTDITEDNKYVYNYFLYTNYGLESFQYREIKQVDDKSLVYTQNGNIYKYDIAQDKIIDSVYNENTWCIFLRVTPAGKYFYAIDDNIDKSPIHIWPTDNFQDEPEYIMIRDSYTIPPITDNLRALVRMEDMWEPTIAIIDVRNGNFYAATPYSSNLSPTISSNGEYIFYYDNGLKIGTPKNFETKVVWEDGDWSRRYYYANFDPIEVKKFYTWDEDDIFSIRSLSDTSMNVSYPLVMERIENIDFYSRKIMGFAAGKILVYDLDNGDLIQEIPANIDELFLYSNDCILIGNTIYSNHGIKYYIKDN